MKKKVNVQHVLMAAKVTGLPKDTLEAACGLYPQFDTLEDAHEWLDGRKRVSDEMCAIELERLAAKRARAAKTLDEARRVWKKAPPGGHAQATAYEKWRRFSAIEVAAISSLKDAVRACKRAPNGSPEQDAASIEWFDLYDAAQGAIGRTDNPYVQAPRGSAGKERLLYRSKVPPVQAKKGETLKEARDTFKSSSSEIIKWEAYVRWVRLANSLDDAKEAYDACGKGSSERHLALKKWREFAAAEVNAAQTLEAASEAHARAPDGSKEKEAAYAKWRTFSASEVGLINGRARAELVHDRAPTGSHEKFAALTKWRKISAQEIKAAETWEETFEAYERAPVNSPERKAALVKIVQLVNSP